MSEDQQPNPVPGQPPALPPLKRTKIVLSSAALVLGIATIAVTFEAGGGIQSRGVLLGAILATMAGLRLWLTLRHNA